MARAYTIEELAVELGCSKAALYRRRIGDRLVFDDGQELPIIRFGRRMRVPRAAADRLIDEGLTTPTNENTPGPSTHSGTGA